MKIATWNIERPTKTGKRIPLIINCLREIDADILILTETNEAINPGNQYNSFHTANLMMHYTKKGRGELAFSQNITELAISTPVIMIQAFVLL